MCSARCMTSCYSFPLLLLLIFTFLSTLGAQPYSEADTISWDRHLSGNQTIASREGNFELGFFRPGNSSNLYIGIWYKKIPKKTIVWVANREVPVSSASLSELGISRDGKLVLYQNGNLVWSSHSHATTLAANSTVAVLLDTGNLVLRDRNNSSAIIWQSFDHLTDTLLPRGWIGMNKITGEYQSLNSWKSTEDPSPGPFTCTIDPDGTNQAMLMWNGTVSYWKSGFLKGRDFSNVPAVISSEIFKFVLVDNSQQRYIAMIPLDNTTIARGVMDTSGQVSGYFWIYSAQDWLPIWSAPSILCDVYSACGAFGICDQQSTIVCACPPGFEPTSIKEWNLNSWSDGCTRKTPLQCGNNSASGESDGFLILQNMLLPANPHLQTGRSLQQCKLACLNNCSCTAYTYTNAKGCLLWIGGIRNLQQLHHYDNNAGTLYLRLAASDISKSSNKNKIDTKIIIVSLVAVILLMIIGLIWISPRMLYQTWKPADGPLVSFPYNDLQHITKNFSDMLGRGGFGSVFRGVLADSTIVAVKKLEGLRQGEKQFRTEVSTLGTIQHVNLVRLRGFCCKGTKRLLVYDYMPNGSLDNLLFKNKSSALDWRTRYQIILGIAKGIEYLHEKCRECIIHCDIKPENILIDADFCPKVADFGMAKLLSRIFSRVLTTMRGTIGYMAPEWTSGQPITPKVDVYSYGMMLFEIVHGRRNTDQYKDERFNYFPVWAVGRVIEGEVLSILDENLDGNANLEELGRVCKVACWCIQDYEAHRPSMGQVVLMLEGVMEVHIAPVPSYLQRLTCISSGKSDTSGCANARGSYGSAHCPSSIISSMSENL